MLMDGDADGIGERVGRDQCLAGSGERAINTGMRMELW